VLGSGLDLVLKWCVVFAGNAVDVMLTQDHDWQFISISRFPSVAVAIFTFHNCHRRDGVHPRPQARAHRLWPAAQQPHG